MKKILFGKYPQSEKAEEYPLVWDVIKENGDSLYCVSDKVLFACDFCDSPKFADDSMPRLFFVTHFRKSRLYYELNSSFKRKAFSKEEEKRLMYMHFSDSSCTRVEGKTSFDLDTFKIGVPSSLDVVCPAFSDKGICTDYAAEHCPVFIAPDTGWTPYWLSDHGEVDEKRDIQMNVYYDGKTVCTESCENYEIGVRPTIMLMK